MTELSLVLEPETPADGESILRLNERVFGPGRFARTAYRIRETTAADLSLSFVARVGTLLVGANAMTPSRSNASTSVCSALADSPAPPTASAKRRPPTRA